MRTSSNSCAAAALAAFLFAALGTVRCAEAQTAYGISSIQYSPETTLVEGYSATELDYLACYYYDPAVEGFLFQGANQVDYGADQNTTGCTAAVDTSTFATADGPYTEGSNHYVVAYYYDPALGYYDPYGFSLYGGEYGGSYSFLGCQCGGYVYAELIYLGSTAATITLPCSRTPSLSATASEVMRGNSATFRLNNLCTVRQIKNWTFSDGTHTVTRAVGTANASWGGSLVTGGSVSVTVVQGGTTYNLSQSITVKARDFAFQAVQPHMVTAPFNCNGGQETLPSPPEPGTRGGVSCLHPYYIFNPSSVGDNGPNQGYWYVTSAKDRSQTDKEDYSYAIVADLTNPASDFFRSQCGDYDPVTMTGYISGQELLANVTNHESGPQNSHYQEYVAAQNDPANNVGTGLEQVIAPPGTSNAAFNQSVQAEGNRRSAAIDKATDVEPCGDGAVRRPDCTPQPPQNFNQDAQGNPRPYVPCRPSGLSAAAVSSTQVNLKWTDNSWNENGFVIGRATGSGTPSEYDRVGANQASYSDVKAAPDTDYTYQVWAFVGSIFSWPSNLTKVHTPKAGTSGGAPAPPTGASAAAASSSQVTISWTAGASGQDGFKIERKSGGGTYAQIAQVPGNVTTYADATVAPATTYTYRVKAFNSAGDSDYSNEISATTPSAPASPPAAPSGLTAAAAGSTEVDLAWIDNGAGNENGFTVERRTGAGGYAPIATVAANVTSYADRSAVAATTYTYRVKSFNGAGNSGYSNEASATTATSDVPAPPSNLVVGIQTGEIILYWTSNSTNELGFMIERRSGDGAYGQIATVGHGVTNYTDTSVVDGSPYAYRVRAYNAAGTSAYSNEASGTTYAPGPPAPPANLTATAVSSSEVDLAWTYNHYDELGFRIERSSGGAAFVEIGSTPALVTSYADTTAAPYTAYTYRVRAWSNNGDSLYANMARVSTPSLPGAGPAAPCCLQANAFSNGGYASVSLSWVPRSTDESGFVVERLDPGSTSWWVVAAVPAGSSNLGDTTVALASTYSYRVGAYNSSGKNYSAVVEVTTPPN